MRTLAEFVMRGRSQAILVSVIAGLLPFMQWLSVSVVSLVILRKGGAEGALIAGLAAIPATLFFYLTNNPSSMLALIGTIILATTLRLTASWELTLVTCVVVSILSGWFFELFAMDLLTIFSQSYLEFMREMKWVVTLDLSAVKSLFVGYLALGQAWAMILFLVLARWWQSLLYNPGGFRKEFHALRLSPKLASVLVLALLVLLALGNTELQKYQQLLVFPLAVAGLGFAHWYMGKKQKEINWTPLFYVTFVLFFQILYPVMAALALLDSWVDFRKKVNDSMTEI